MISCHREIAADGAFTLGMLAKFGESIRARGWWWWRRLFREAGVLGQELYFEAEAAGIRGTGIGCYHDDAFREVFGCTDVRFQSPYHFTCGGPAEDLRIQTQPPYAHLAGRWPARVGPRHRRTRSSAWECRWDAGSRRPGTRRSRRPC